MPTNTGPNPRPDKSKLRLLDALGFLAPKALMTLLNVTEDEVALATLEGRILASTAAHDQSNIGGLWTEAWPHIARVELDQAFTKCLGREKVRLRLTRQGGDTDAKLWELRLAPLPQKDGSLGAVMIVSRDLTANAGTAPTQG